MTIFKRDNFGYPIILPSEVIKKDIIENIKKNYKDLDRIALVGFNYSKTARDLISDIENDTIEGRKLVDQILAMHKEFEK